MYAELARLFTPEQIVALTAFGAVMLATNVFNNALRVDLDGYLEPFRCRGHRTATAVGAPDAAIRGQGGVVTGAAHGQGRAAALALAREGARIAALDVARPLAYPGYGLGTPDDLATLAAALPRRWAPSA